MSEENKLVIYFPDSPDTPITITRGGNDLIFNEPQGDRFVNIKWEEEEQYIDPDTEEVKTRTVVRGSSFKGPKI